MISSTGLATSGVDTLSVAPHSDAEEGVPEKLRTLSLNLILYHAH
jgi:hypothetical protein